MFVLGNLVQATAQILNSLLEAYKWVLVITALLSWVNPDPYNPIVRFLRAVVDPFRDAIRRVFPFTLGPIDFSLLIGILLIQFTQMFLVRSLMDLSYRLK